MATPLVYDVEEATKFLDLLEGQVKLLKITLKFAEELSHRLRNEITVLNNEICLREMERKAS